jgi:aminoglycoside 6'-N-acetyltransferase I
VRKEYGDRSIVVRQFDPTDEVDECFTSPVAFLEGWYVDADVRRRGVGRALVAAAEAWARERGCREFASDAHLDNPESRAAHRALGFEESVPVVNVRRVL